MRFFKKKKKGLLGLVAALGWDLGLKLSKSHLMQKPVRKAVWMVLMTLVGKKIIILKKIKINNRLAKPPCLPISVIIPGILYIRCIHTTVGFIVLL